jgi:adenylate cyclase, class 2
MPLEIEIKLKVGSHEGVRARLRELGAEHAGRVREENIFFDRADGSLRAADCGLRLRLTRAEGTGVAEALVTFKGPAGRGGLRSREAFDVRATPLEQVVPLVEALGFVRQYSFEKDRESWGIGGCLVELDRLPVFELFVEIEGPSEEAVRAVQRELGIGDVPAHEESYSRMVGEYLRREGIRELRFG